MYPDADSPDNNLRSRANRVSRACDRCRIRKIKCNGKSQCNRCSVDDAICVYTKKRRPNDRAYSKEYVQLLEEQRTALVKGVKELYRRSSVGQCLPDLPSGCGESMLIHEVLSSLDVLPKKVDPSDLDQIAYDEEISMSSNVSVCDSTNATSFTDPQAPVLSMSPSSSNDSVTSPILPAGTEFEGLMNSFDNGQFQMMQYVGEPTTKAFPAEENTFSEAFSEAYLLNNPELGLESPMPGQDFVNPRDMSYSTTFHLTHAYTT